MTCRPPAQPLFPESDGSSHPSVTSTQTYECEGQIYELQISQSTSGYDLTVIAGQKLIVRYRVEFLANEAAPQTYAMSGLEVFKQVAKSQIRGMHRLPN